MALIPCSWSVGSFRLSSECRKFPYEGKIVLRDSITRQLYFLSHGTGFGMVTPFWSSEWMMKVEGNTRGKKQRAPRGRGRGKRTNFQSTDLVVTVSNEDSSSRLKPPVTASQPRKIVLNRRTGKLNELILCVSLVKTKLRTPYTIMVFFHFRIHWFGESDCEVFGRN